MTLILSHGQPKSGSTFLFQSARLAVDTANGMDLGTFRDRFFSSHPFLKDDHRNFINDATDDIIERLLAAIPPEYYYLIKLHGDIGDFAKRQIENGRIRAFTSIRDPRDAAISMFDSGIRDREVKGNRWFSELTELSRTINAVKSHVSKIRKWVSCRNVMVFPYYLTSTHQDVAVHHLLKHLGLSRHAEIVTNHFATNKTERILEFHKGIADRFLEDISPQEVGMLTEKLSPEITQIDMLTERWMAHHGYRVLFHMLNYKRQTRLAEILGGAQAEVAN